jgi:hypothetical protein
LPILSWSMQKHAMARTNAAMVVNPPITLTAPASKEAPVSAGKFTWRRAGFVGPLRVPVTGKTASEIARLALSAAAGEGHVDFRAFDTNHDRTISPDELTILIVANVPGHIGQANHFHAPGGFRFPGAERDFCRGGRRCRRRRHVWQHRPRTVPHAGWDRPLRYWVLLPQCRAFLHAPATR